jgi:hypothetical protein
MEHGFYSNCFCLDSGESVWKGIDPIAIKEVVIKINQVIGSGGTEFSSVTSFGGPSFSFLPFHPLLSQGVGGVKINLISVP